MENSEFKKYRSDLAKEIRQEPDRTKRGKDVRNLLLTL